MISSKFMKHKTAPMDFQIEVEDKQKQQYVLKSVLLGAQVINLFTLKSAIKDNTILCVPFSLKIPKNFAVSYNQNLDLDGSDGTDLKGLELRRIQIQKQREDINYSGFIKRTIQNIHERVRGNKLASKLNRQ